MLDQQTSHLNLGANPLTTYALLAAIEATVLIRVCLIWLAILA
jgi:hypothetical protein